jgi:hypothetical protein
MVIFYYGMFVLGTVCKLSHILKINFLDWNFCVVFSQKNFKIFLGSDKIYERSHVFLLEKSMYQHNFKFNINFSNIFIYSHVVVSKNVYLRLFKLFYSLLISREFFPLKM